MKTAMTEIERAALTNLYNFKQTIRDPKLFEYVEKLCTDENYKYIANELHTEDRADFYNAITDDIERRSAKMAGRAIWSLATSVAVYRSQNRPSGDVTSTIDRMAGFTVTTSLAANVAEFTQNILNAYLID